jgi:hypothetical protein
MRVRYLAIIALVGCAKTEEQPVAKRDTGVAPARVTTETKAQPDNQGGVPAVPSDSTARSARVPTEGAVHIKPPAESLRVKP